MKLGFGLPMAGDRISPESLLKVACRAEELGYDSLWTWERLLVPLCPQTGYIGTADGSYPEYFKRSLDPLDLLSFVAARTSRIRLGVSVLVMGHYHPLTLARRAATIDFLSGGRLDLGLGQGWSKDEHDAMGVAMSYRARRADEFLEVMRRAWTDDVVEFHGKFFDVPASRIDLKPVQKPGVPIYLAAFAPGAMKRIALSADGWTPVAVPIDQMRPMMDSIRQMAREAGRDGDALKLSVRGNIHLTSEPLTERYPFVGSWEQVVSDIRATRDSGADELFVEPQGECPEEFIRVMERVREVVDAR
jgi:probable F420-dependent oxidoreductase